MPFLFVHKICPVSCLQIFRFVSRLYGNDERIVVSLSEYQCKIYLPIYYNVSNLPLKMLCSTRESLFTGCKRRYIQICFIIIGTLQYESDSKYDNI